MKKFKFLLLTFIAALFSFGCASTKMSSFTDAETQLSTSEKIAVFATTSDIELRKTIEKKFLAAFGSKKINIVSTLQLIEPLNEYSYEDLLEIMAENNVKYFMTVEMPANGIYEYPCINYEVKIIEVESEKLFYRATGYAEADKVPEYSAAAGDLAKKVCAEYITFIRKPVKPDPLAQAGINVASTATSDVDMPATEDDDEVSEADLSEDSETEDAEETSDEE